MATVEYSRAHRVDLKPVIIDKPVSQELNQQEIEKNLGECNFSHWHWSYQPIRFGAISLPNGDLYISYDITGRNSVQNRWGDPIYNDPKYPVSCHNSKILAECYGPLLDDKTMQSEQFGIQMSPSLLDWIKYHNPQYHDKVLNVLKEKPKFATTYSQYILPSLPRRIQELTVNIGIESYKKDFGQKPYGFWPAELAINDETLDVLANANISILILGRYQLEAEKDAPLYIVKTKSGRSVYVIPFDENVSRKYGFEDHEAREYAMSLPNSNGLHDGRHWTKKGANDSETIGHHRRRPSLAFAQWLYTKYLPQMVSSGVHSFSESLHDAQPARLKPGVTSWSDPHGMARWTGESIYCNCGNSNTEIQMQKNELYNQIVNAMTETVKNLDLINPHWEKDFSRWFLSQRKNIGSLKPVDVAGVRKNLQKPFLELYTELNSIQSCFAFNGRGGEYERTIATGGLETLRQLKKYR